MDKEPYNDDPVYYCRRCLSLRIRQMPMVSNKSYCEDCGNADIGETDIKDWDEMYFEKYGHYFIEKESSEED